MKHPLLSFALLFLLVVSAAGQSSMSRFPSASTASGGKRVHIWETGVDETITITNLFKDRTLVAPILGAATATTINKITFTAPASGATLTLVDGKTLTVSNTLTFSGTDASSVAFGTGGTVAYLGGTQTFTGTKTFNASVLVAVTASGSSAINLSGSSGDFSTTTGVNNFKGSVNNFDTAPLPTTSDGAALGSASKMWSDLYLASGSVINWDAGDLTLTHAANILTLAGGDLRVSTAGTNAASVVTVGGTQTLTAKTFVAPILGAATATTINGVTITGAGTLNLVTGSSLITAGAYAATLTTTGTTGVTLPTTGTLEARSTEARTATADGTGTGTITATSSFVTVTSDDTDKIVILPAAVVGKRVTIQGPATAFELRSSSPTTIAINGGTGAAAESAIPASSTVYLECTSSSSWKGFILDADGDFVKLEAAAP